MPEHIGKSFGQAGLWVVPRAPPELRRRLLMRFPVLVFGLFRMFVHGGTPRVVPGISVNNSRCSLDERTEHKTLGD